MSVIDDPWARLRATTRARIGLGRAGDGLPTSELLAFQMAHAKARDAVHGNVAFEVIAADLAPLVTIEMASAADDRATYLRRPDLGRRLRAGGAVRLPRGPFDVVFVIGDGLSAAAVEANAAATIVATLPRLAGLTVGPVILARQARVALGDPIGATMNASVVVMLIGERPGLTAADSLGAYLTFAPVPGRRDSERNCLSNIHAHGLPPDRAAVKIAWLVRESLRSKLSGIDLKENAPDGALETAAATIAIGSG
jgi:ethanolamine ammonia-lyase small subunit